MAQRLLPGATDKAPVVPAVELLFVNGVIKKMIQDGEDARIPEALRNQAKNGMQDFNMSIYQLVKSGMVSEQDAIDHAPNPDQLRMQLKGMVLNQDAGAVAEG
jgi:twitching motility protein PilT